MTKKDGKDMKNPKVRQKLEVVTPIANVVEMPTANNEKRIEAAMANQALTGVKKAEVIERVVARCVKDKVWRTECEQEALVYASKAERAAVKAFVLVQYEIAGAGFAGRWQ